MQLNDPLRQARGPRSAGLPPAHPGLTAGEAASYGRARRASARRGWMVLEALDPGTEHGRVYRALVCLPRAGVAELATETGIKPDTVRRLLHELVARNVAVALDGGAWEAHSPAEITESALRRDAVRRAEARQSGTELERLFRFVRREEGHYGALEVLADTERILATMQRMQRAATQEMRIIDRPPYFAQPSYYANQETLQFDRMAAGVGYRTIYYESAFNDGTIPDIPRMIAAGEQARTLKEPPMKLVIADDQLAVVTLEAEGGQSVVALLIRPSSLFTALSNTFETLWKLAVPISAVGVDALEDDRDRVILTLMASGATDEAIARRLDLSRRTVVRRVAMLLDRLGATTRFQAGVQAARRGWL
ncbi:helix-turn-helix transcriptional regulator [Crossiella sp. CA198]|uniref:helix-turn-helix transcriptional regulator n=1 Tax=Crossiella sp. CA198 TaxID=3455607 RepID=UPI003F8D3182